MASFSNYLVFVSTAVAFQFSFQVESEAVVIAIAIEMVRKLGDIPYFLASSHSYESHQHFE